VPTGVSYSNPGRSNCSPTRSISRTSGLDNHQSSLR
jgi:hypothetical protein